MTRFTQQDRNLAIQPKTWEKMASLIYFSSQTWKRRRQRSDLSAFSKVNVVDDEVTGKTLLQNWGTHSSHRQQCLNPSLEIALIQREPPCSRLCSLPSRAIQWLTDTEVQRPGSLALIADESAGLLLILAHPQDQARPLWQRHPSAHPASQFLVPSIPPTPNAFALKKPVSLGI